MADNLNDQDFYKEFRNRMNMDPLHEAGENKKTVGHTLTIILAVFTGIVISSLVGWYVIGNMMVSKTGNINSLSDLPTIRRVSSQVKIKPDDEGGMKIANREKKVYNLIGKNDQENNVKEKVVSDKSTVVAPAEEEYIDNDPVYSSEEDVSEKVSLPSSNDTVTISAIPAASNEVVTEPAVTEKEKTEKKETVSSENKKPTSILPKEPDKIPAKATETKAPAVASTNTESVKKETATKSVVASDVFQVQVTSAKDEKQVKTVLNNLLKKFPEVKNMPNEIQKADLGKKGVYYRLKIGNFKTREEAMALCAKLKAKGQDCIVSKK